jgi:uncharacterized membrane protein HdeD (DUF308 family)
MAKKTFSTNNVVNAIVYGVIGLLLIILKAGSLNILMTAIGVLFIALGVMDIVNTKDLTKGIIEVALGVVVIVCGWLIVDIVLLILGIVLIVKSVMEIAQNYKKGFKANLPAIISLVIGIIFALAKWVLWSAIDIVCIIVGVIFLIDAVLMLMGKQLLK